MIRQIFIITSAGLLAYSRNFVAEEVDADLISGFLTAMSSFAMEIKGGSIEKMEFMEFQFLYSIDENYEIKFVLCCDKDDLIDDARDRLEIAKKEFLNRYNDRLKNWNGEVNIFRTFNEFADKNLVIPPKIYFIGPQGAGKTTILDLFPGETILSLDEDLNEIIKKSIEVTGLGLINQIDLWEFDIDEIINNPKYYRDSLNAGDVIFLVTESSGTALGRTMKSYKQFKNLLKDKNVDAIIANKQDLRDVAFTPEQIKDNFDQIDTYGFNTTSEDAQENIYSILGEILGNKYAPREISD